MPCSGGGICHGVNDVLCARIWCAITQISPLVATVLWLGTAALDPLGILHMAAFVTLYEAYMGIEPHFNLWNYFFHVWLEQGSSTEVVAFGSVDIFAWFGCGVDPYFHLLTSGP
jgi:hypothetical protein